MPDIHIQREHGLGLPQARQLASRWAELAQEKFDMDCSYEQGEDGDVVSFKRSGVNGELKVSGDSFELDARLGFLVGMFRERIETEITSKLDELLAQDEPLQAFDLAVAQATARSSAGKAAAKDKGKA